MCEAHGYCYWRDTTSQNYQGWAEYVGYAPSITEMVPGAYDISSQTGGVARVQVVVTANGIVLYDCMDNPTQGALAKEALRARIGSKVRRFCKFRKILLNLQG